jgi:hypothetical protein
MAGLTGMPIAPPRDMTKRTNRGKKKMELNTQTEGKVRPGGAKPSEWQRGGPRSEHRLQDSTITQPSKKKTST